MTLDRGEVAGTGAALLLHVALIVALTMNLARVPTPAEPPPVAVEIVDSDEVALRAAAPTPVTTPPPSEAPEIGEAPPAEPLPTLPQVEPTPAPPPPQPVVRAAPTPALRAAPQARPTPAPRVQPPSRPTTAPRSVAPSRSAPPQRTAPRVSRIGDDFLKGIPDAPAGARSSAPPQQAASFSAAAKASVDQAIKRQIQPCADRQPAIGPGAERIRVTLNLRLNRDGRLSRPPSVVRTSGVDEENSRFEDLVTDQAIRVFRECAPLRLPAELYSTPTGGWSNINLVYRVP